MSALLRWLDMPPVWLVLLMAAGRELQRIAPLSLPDATRPGGHLVILLALAVAAWSAVVFLRSRTSIIPGETASALVTSGPYRLSRNPIYLADLAILAGFGPAIGSLWPILLTPLLGWILLKRFILPEEAMLKREFPDDFADWASRVRRWI